MIVMGGKVTSSDASEHHTYFATSGHTSARNGDRTPTPGSTVATATPMPTEERPTAGLTPTTRPVTILAIAVAPIAADIPEYSRSYYKHWIDEDADCQDARQEVLIAESLVEVAFESERKCGWQQDAGTAPSRGPMSKSRETWT